MLKWYTSASSFASSSSSFSSSSSMFPAIPLGFTIFGEIFVYGTVFFFQSSCRGSHILSSWMVHAGVFLLPAFAHLGHECQGLLSPCDGMHVCTD